MAHRDELLEAVGHEQHRDPGRREFADEPVDLASSRRRRARGSGGRGSAGAANPETSHRASTAFCWLPPDRDPSGAAADRGADAESLDPPVGERPLLAGAAAAGRRTPRAMCGRVMFSATDIVADHALAPALRGHVADVGGDRGARVIAAVSGRPSSVDASALRLASAPKMLRHSSSRPEPCTPAMPSTSPAWMSKSTSSQTPAHREPAHREAHLLARRQLRLLVVVAALEVAPDHHAPQRRLVDVARACTRRRSGRCAARRRGRRPAAPRRGGARRRRPTRACAGARSGRTAPRSRRGRAPRSARRAARPVRRSCAPRWRAPSRSRRAAGPRSSGSR